MVISSINPDERNWGSLNSLKKTKTITDIALVSIQAGPFSSHSWSYLTISAGWTAFPVICEICQSSVLLLYKSSTKLWLSSPPLPWALQPSCWGRCRPSSGRHGRNVCQHPKKQSVLVLDTVRMADTKLKINTWRAKQLPPHVNQAARFTRRAYLDGSDGEGNLPPTIDVRVENTKNVLELLRDDQRLKTQNVQSGIYRA